MVSLEKLLHLPSVAIHRLDIIEFNPHRNEEKRIKDTVTASDDSFKPRHILLILNEQLGEIENLLYILVEDSNTDYAVIVNNIMIISKIIKFPYFDLLVNVSKTFISFSPFQVYYLNSQQYLEKDDYIINNKEYNKGMPSDYKLIVSETLVNSLF